MTTIAAAIPVHFPLSYRKNLKLPPEHAPGFPEEKL